MKALSLSSVSLVNTRPAHQAVALTEMLRDLGAKVFEFPTLAIIPALECSRQQIEFELNQLQKSDWVIFTSSNGVIQTFSKCENYNLLKGKQIAVIGEGTKETLEQYGAKASFVGRSTNSEIFCENFLSHLHETGERNPGTTRRVLLFRAELGSPVLPQGLKNALLDVVSLVVYRSVIPQVETKMVLQMAHFLGLGAKQNPAQFPGLIFSSSEAVRNFFRILEGFNDDLPDSWIGDVQQLPAFVIGPVTEATVRELGFETVVLAPRAAINDLVHSVIVYIEQRESKMVSSPECR